MRLVVGLLSLIVAALGQSLLAQTNLVLGQYTELLPYYNPASIAQVGEMQLRAVHNRQFEGVEGASKSFLLQANLPLRLMGTAHGLGVQMHNDSFGLFADTELTGQFAARISLGKGKLHIGAGLSLISSRFSGSKIYIPDGVDGMSRQDDALPKTDVSGRGMDASIGLYYYHPKYWVGLSTSQLLAPTILLGERYKRERTRTYTLAAGYNYCAIESLLTWTPSLLAQVDERGTYRLEGRIDAWYRERFHVAALYRYASAVGINLGIKLGKAYLGYQYELPLSELRAASWGNHEVMLAYSIPINMDDSKPTKYKSIRLL